MSRDADLWVLTKNERLPHLAVRSDAILEARSAAMTEPLLIPVSARTGEGIDQWVEWLFGRRAVARSKVGAAVAP